MNSTTLTKPVDLQGLSLALAKTKADYESKIGSPDWNENDSNSKNYIANRTHWVEEGEDTEIINETVTFEDSDTGYGNESSNYYESVYNQLKDAEAEKYVVVFDGQTYSGYILNDDSVYGFGNKSMYDSKYDDTGEPFFAYVGFGFNYYFNLRIKSTYTGTHSITIYISPKVYHKLNNKYLDGVLITKGDGKQSEIFNGKPVYDTAYASGLIGKQTIGDYAHIEGLGRLDNTFSIILSGGAGVTEYALTNFYKGYTYSDLLVGKELLDNYGDATGIFIESISSIDEDSYTATMTVSATLSANEAINEQRYRIAIAGSIANEGSHAEGFNTKAVGRYSHSENCHTTANGDYSHAEGRDTLTNGESSHAEGWDTLANGRASHAEGYYTTASGDDSHAEGSYTTASSSYSHAEGSHTTASGSYSHAEGYYTTASGLYSHAEGEFTTAQRRSQHVFGEYNTLDTGGSSTSSRGTYIEIVGKGTSNTARSNARTLDWNGNEVLAGKLTVGAAPTNNMDVATKQYVDNAVGSGSGGSSTLVGLTDTSISSPTNGQVLMYNSSTGKWENTSLPIYNGGVS